MPAQSIAVLIGRLLLSAIFIQAGLSKLFGLTNTVGYFDSVGLPWPSLIVWPVIVTELVGGLAILVGYRTRWAASILCLFTIVAAFIGHSEWGNIVHFQAFMKDLAIAGGFFYVMANGGGLLALDMRRE